MSDDRRLPGVHKKNLGCGGMMLIAMGVVFVGTLGLLAMFASR